MKTPEHQCPTAWQLTAELCVSTVGSHTTRLQMLKDGPVSVSEIQETVSWSSREVLMGLVCRTPGPMPVLAEAEKA